MVFAVFIRNRKWKKGKPFKRVEDWLEHPYRLGKEDDAQKWGAYLVRSLSEIDEYEVRPTEKDVYEPPSRLDHQWRNRSPMVRCA